MASLGWNLTGYQQGNKKMIAKIVKLWLVQELGLKVSKNLKLMGGLFSEILVMINFSLINFSLFQFDIGTCTSLKRSK